MKYPTQVNSGAAVDYSKAKILHNLTAGVNKRIFRSTIKPTAWPQVFCLKHTWCRILSENYITLYFVIFLCQSSSICSHSSFLQKNYLHGQWLFFFSWPTRTLWSLSMDHYFVTLIRTWDETYWGDLTSSQNSRYFGISHVVWVKT